ncbi:hypothetical protein JT359_08715 [Candidatus Poribacteria bacterium]|nr:hypothetical protein [Candidatus Poribacteria bacterium]
MFWRFIYNIFALPSMLICFKVAGIFNKKIREGIIGRQRVFQELERQLKLSRKIEKTAWFHFTSVGEFEQAKPLIEAIYTNVRIVSTFFSPSVAANVEKYTFLDAAVYLPFDSVRNAKRLIDMINPICLIFSKSDIWPNLVWQSAKNEIPLILIAGTLHPGSKSLSWYCRSFFKSIHKYMTLYCAISESDADRFQRLCTSNQEIVVSGDTRFDQVYKRANSVEPDTNFFPGQSTLIRPVFIAGSTYRDDEKVILDTYQILRKEDHELIPHLIVVPHEPTPERIAEITNDLDRRELSYTCYTKLSEDVDLNGFDVLIIDTVGILAKLYQLASIVFVGGSFHGKVHNVMEPAAMAKPVIFGPTIQNAYEASLLVDREAAKRVETPEQMAEVITEWINSDVKRFSAGIIGKQVIEENIGAVERTLAYLQDYV